MNNFKIDYLFYPILIGICAAWALSGFLTTGVIMPQNDTDQLQFNRVESADPDFNMIAQKNIFNADISTVKSTLDAMGYVQSGGADQSGAGAQGAAAAPDLVLVGVIKGGYLSFAIFSYKGESLVLRVGIPKKGMLLKSVGKDFAIIKKEDGTISKIKLSSGKEDDAAQPKDGQPPAPGQAGAAGPQGGDHLSIDRKDVTSKLSDVNAIMKTADISPASDNSGKAIGYKLSNIKPDSGIAELGLTSGDVIMRLNGKDISNPSIFFDALANSQNLSSLVLDIQRNGVKKTLNVEIKG